MEWLVAGGAAYLFFKWLNKSDNNSEEPKITSPERLITFVGATGTGKSSTINALLGRNASPTDITHDTTKAISRFQYKNDYQLCDTPGLLDRPIYKKKIWSTVVNSKLVVYVTFRQVYRQEQAWIKSVHQLHRKWNMSTVPSNHRQFYPLPK